jgi:hypothetical protein
VLRRFVWRRWWSASGLPALRALAIEHWDPLNAFDDPARADAYDAYLNRVGRMLRRGKGPAELASYLGAVRTKALGREESETADQLFADRVVDWYSLEAPSRRRRGSAASI